MKLLDFENKFYYHNGEAIATIGMIMEGPEGKFYRIVYDRPRDEVRIVSSVHELLDIDRTLLESCFRPMEPSKVPAF